MNKRPENFVASRRKAEITKGMNQEARYVKS